MIKVLFATDTFLLGGTEKNALKIASKLDKAIFESCISYENQHSELLLERARVEGIPCHCIGDNTDETWLKHLLEVRPDIIMTASYTRSKIYNSALQLGIPMIERGNGSSGIPTVYFDRILCENINYAMALRTHLHKVCLPDRTEVVFNGVDKEDYPISDRKQARGKWGMCPAAVIVGVVARVDPIKNIQLQIRAIAKMRENICTSIGTELHVLGPACGDEQNKLRDLAKSLGIEAYVKFHGSSLDVAGFMSACDIISLTSLSEGGPNCLIEAMVMNKPIVATDVGGIREITGGEAIYVKDPQNVLELVDAFHKVTTKEVVYEAARRHDLSVYIGRISSVLEDTYNRYSLARLYAEPKKPEPRTTILIPIHDRVEYLDKAIESVLKQTCPHWKLMIAIDTLEPSSDLMTIINKYTDSRISYTKSPHKNQCSAINHAVSQITTTYTSRLDSDDVLPPDAVETLYSYIEKHHYAGYLYSAYELIDQNGEVRRYQDGRRMVFTAEDFSPLRLEEWYIARCWITWRNHEFNMTNGFDESVDYSEDYLFALMMMLNGARFIPMKQILYQAREHPLPRLSNKYSEDESMRIRDQVRDKYAAKKKALGIILDGESCDHIMPRSLRSNLDVG